jgi:hypothetical protein
MHLFLETEHKRDTKQQHKHKPRRIKHKNKQTEFSRLCSFLGLDIVSMELIFVFHFMSLLFLFVRNDNSTT